MIALLLAVALLAPQKPAPRPAAKAPAAPPAPVFFTTPLTIGEMRGKQAVIETSEGEIVIDLLPEAAPNHVGHFITLARQGAYDGTVFHRMVKYGVIQGGDPLSKDPEAREKYGTGGLNELKAEISAEKHTRGAVSAVLVPGNRDSAGAQFFICITDQPAIDGQYTIFGRVSDGVEVAQKISEAAVDAAGKAVGRQEIRKVTIRDTPPPTPEPFSTETAAELATYRAVVETTLGAITIEFLPDKAPGHVRNFLRLAQAGVFDTTAFHRVVPGFVVQTGALSSRATPLSPKQQKVVRTLPAEISGTPHVKGIVSMARGDALDSASTSFFIVTAPSPALDKVYTVFGRVVDGLSVVDAIEAVPRNGEAPVTRVEVTRVRLERGSR